VVLVGVVHRLSEPEAGDMIIIRAFLSCFGISVLLILIGSAAIFATMK
jgi:hypothetical protein